MVWLHVLFFHKASVHLYGMQQQCLCVCVCVCVCVPCPADVAKFLLRCLVVIILELRTVNSILQWFKLAEIEGAG